MCSCMCTEHLHCSWGSLVEGRSSPCLAVCKQSVSLCTLYPGAFLSLCPALFLPGEHVSPQAPPLPLPVPIAACYLCFQACPSEWCRNYASASSEASPSLFAVRSLGLPRIGSLSSPFWWLPCLFSLLAPPSSSHCGSQVVSSCLHSSHLASVCTPWWNFRNTILTKANKPSFSTAVFGSIS